MLAKSCLSASFTTLLLTLVAGVRGATPATQPPVSMTVNGTPVVWDANDQRALDRQRAGRPAADPNQVARDAARFKRQWLLSEVREVILRQEVRRLGLRVDEAEVQARLAKVVSERGLTEASVAAIGKKLGVLKAALIAWNEDPNRDADLYTTSLEPAGISTREWQAAKRSYDTPAKAAAIEIPQDLAAMLKHSRLTARRDLLLEKLADHVAGDTVAEPNETLDPNEARVQRERDRARRFGRWLRQRIRQADIKAVDPAFEDLVASFRARVGAARPQ